MVEKLTREETKIAKQYADFIDDFVAKTPDFARYSLRIEKWFKKHTDPTDFAYNDIAYAYYIVKTEAIKKQKANKRQIKKLSKNKK